MVVEAVINLAEDALSNLSQGLFKIIRGNRLFVIRRDIQATKLMEDVHVASVYFIFSINFAITDHTQSFFISNSLLDLGVVEIVIPKDRVVRSEYIIIISIISIRLASRWVLRAHVE